ncbi:PorT family protein [Flavobacterium humi]|uniref:PorT family protein n=1 Tax=Flavobacterium humi TaxID=2562683 RepID=A0A4Z0L7Z5_9FLAO|nr:PorT family protein [Flavobacterium humi]TGD58643.1 PorT family protein [Flavobacterium humi]
MKKIFIWVFVLFSVSLSAQYGRRDGNRIGISGGITQTSLMTSNFDANPESGWIGGFSVRGNYYNNFSMVFGMQFTESRFSVASTTLLAQNKDVDYKFLAAQIRLLLSYNIVEDHLSIELGPVLQVNDKLKFNRDDAKNTIAGTALTVADIEDVTKINGNLYMGISAGSKQVKAVLSYQYGVNNFLNNLNKSEELTTKNNGDFKGHLGILSGQLLINL